MGKFKQQWWRSIYSERLIVDVVGATMITRRTYVLDRLVWQTFWIRFGDKQVVKLSKPVDSKTVTRFNKLINDL